MTIITVLGNNSFLIFVKKRGSDVEGEAPQGPHLLAGPKDPCVTIIIWWWRWWWWWWWRGWWWPWSWSWPVAKCVWNSGWSGVSPPCTTKAWIPITAIMIIIYILRIKIIVSRPFLDPFLNDSRNDWHQHCLLCYNYGMGGGFQVSVCFCEVYFD